MICYQHQDRQAVGICTVFGKGTCMECCADLGDALACKGKHEDAAVKAQAVLQRIATLPRAQVDYFTPFAFAASGLIFIVAGLWVPPRSFIMAALGVAFVGLGVITLVRSIRSISRITSNAA